MSADNYILIRKESTQWVGYMEYASLKHPSYKLNIFKAPDVEKAIVLAQGMNTEYGYRFEFRKDEE